MSSSAPKKTVASYFPPPLIRRSELLACVLAGTVICASILAGVVSRRGAWLGWLPATVTAWALACVFAVAIASALGAWLGGALRRSGLDEWVASAPNGIQRSMRRPLIIGAGATWAGALVALGSVLVWGARYRLDWTVAMWQSAAVVGIVLIALVAAVSFGCLLGRICPAFLAIPLGPMTIYLAYSLIMSSFDDPSWQQLWFSDSGEWSVATQSSGLLGLRSLFWCALALAAGCWATARRRASITAALVTVTLGAVVVGMPSSSAYVPIAASRGEYCQKGTPGICVPRPQQAGLSVFAQEVHRGLAQLPRAYHPQRVVSGLSAPKPGDLVLAPSDGRFSSSSAPSGDVVMMQLGEALFTRSCTTSSKEWESADALMYWWAQRAGIDPSLEIAPGVWSVQSGSDQERRAAHRAQRIQGMSDEARQAWFVQHHKAVINCSLATKELPR